MSQIVYGRKAIGMPIPANIIFWCRVYTVLGAVIITAVKTAPFIDTGSAFQQTVEWFFTSTIGAVNLLLPMIGVDVKEQKVPIENVASIETDGK